jgi:hypothetical protein
MVPENPFVRKTFCVPLTVYMQVRPMAGGQCPVCASIERCKKRSDRAPVVIIISSGYWLAEDATKFRNR